MRPYQRARYARLRSTPEFVGASQISGRRRKAIFERDGWVCQLCLKPVDRSLPSGDPGAPTIDHVVPVALGGDHADDNLRLAHRWCNNSRNTMDLAEWRRLKAIQEPLRAVLRS